jgi:hypothetical protein
MRIFHSVNSLVVTRNWRLVLLSKIRLVLTEVKTNIKNFEDSKSVLNFSLASRVVGLLAIL